MLPYLSIYMHPDDECRKRFTKYRSTSFSFSARTIRIKSTRSYLDNLYKPGTYRLEEVDVGEIII